MPIIANMDDDLYAKKLAASKDRQKKLKGNRKEKQKHAFAKYRHDKATERIIDKRETMDEEIDRRAQALMLKRLPKEIERIQHRLDKETKKQRTKILHAIKLKTWQLNGARRKVPLKVQEKTAAHLEMMRAKVAGQTNRLIYIARHTLIFFQVFNQLNIYPPFGGFLAWAFQYEYFSVKEFKVAFPNVDTNYYRLLATARKLGFIRHIHTEGTIKQFTLSPEGKEYTRKLLKYIYKLSGFTPQDNMRKKRTNALSSSIEYSEPAYDGLEQLNTTIDEHGMWEEGA